MFLFLSILICLLFCHQARGLFDLSSIGPLPLPPPPPPPTFSDTKYSEQKNDFNPQTCNPIILYKTKEIKIPFPVVKEVPVIKEVPIFVKQIVKVPYVVHVPVKEEKIVEDIVLSEDHKSSANEKQTTIVAGNSNHALTLEDDSSKVQSNDRKLSDAFLESTDKVFQHLSSIKSSSSNSLTSSSTSSAPSSDNKRISIATNDFQLDPMYVGASSKHPHTMSHTKRHRTGQLASKSTSRARKTSAGAGTSIGSASLSMAAVGSVVGNKRARLLK